MAGEFTDSGSFLALRVLSGSWSSSTSTSARYLVLFTAAPPDATGPYQGGATWNQNEAQYYTRQSVTFGTPSLNTAGIYETANSNTVTVTASAGSQIITHAGLSTGTSTSAGANDLVAIWTLQTSRSFAVITPLQAVPGALKLAVD